MFGMIQYCLGRLCLLKCWHTIPILNNVERLHAFRGFTIIQTFSDLIHVIAVTFQYFMSGNVYESVLCYMITDLMYYPNVFIINIHYLVHHLLTIAVICLAINYGVSVDKVNHIAFYFEAGLLPISTMDFMSAYGLLIPMFFYLVRPLVYFSSRVYIIYHHYNIEYFWFVLPILIHNTYILYCQLRSLLRHAVLWNIQHTLQKIF